MNGYYEDPPDSYFYYDYRDEDCDYNDDEDNDDWSDGEPWDIDDDHSDDLIWDTVIEDSYLDGTYEE